MNDLDRLRIEYANRQLKFANSDIYSYFNPAYLFMVQSRQRALLKTFKNLGIDSLAEKQILEVGCGQGRILLDLITYGASPENLAGCDLIFSSLSQAHHTLPLIKLTCSDGQNLPFPDASFDLVFQSTVFSSILDDLIRNNIAQEMIRVLRPRGFIIWYDFFYNPYNPQTRGVRIREIRNLFPDCQIDYKRITLAPPISRKLANFSWILCYLLEKIWILNSHYLASIKIVNPK